MATYMKRYSYVSDTESSSYDDGDNDLPLKYRKQSVTSHPNRKRCSSRNAILARENRIKKKLYMQNLEQELKILRKDNSKLNLIVESQSFEMAQLQKRLKYMNSMLANSADLRLLMKNIQCNTGMSVTTSLDKTLTLNNDCISKPQTKLPWSEEPVQSSSLSTLSDLDILKDEPFSDLLFDLEMDYNGENRTSEADGSRNEHNYTLATKLLNDGNRAPVNDVGVCLHVSKHRVSLEFCPSCSENASATWSK